MLGIARVIGFKELPWHYCPDGPSLVEAVRSAPGAVDAQVIAYLRAGVVFAARPMVVPDFLRPEREFASTSHWHTDGDWVWPSDLAYYVEEHHAELPAAFVAHQADNAWICPRPADAEVARIAAWWAAERYQGGRSDAR